MQSTQELILGKVEAIIKDVGYTPTISKKYGNTGVINALDDSLDVIHSIAYDFQTDYFTLTVFDGPRKRHRDGVRLSTVGSKTNSEVLTRVREIISTKAR